jgi:hypothetical protein
VGVGVLRENLMLAVELDRLMKRRLPGGEGANGEGYNNGGDGANRGDKFLVVSIIILFLFFN